ncbi:integral membrane-like protein [Phenylobacterium soli]|uniref:Integral membrane-like protein n=1 Tax=Phenylobacterium soli TaxID=2170551 RepID=A0A328AKH6_9CAUL|nr:integral membrane-like protein [Phenylobacterium soli]RAK55099.1 integral membrane-like protein [Phenylobacterium soli]
MARAWWVILLVATALMAPLLIAGANGLDSGAYNYTWTRQFAEGLARGELYPRWLPGSFRGLGSPAFFFYPPLAFYLAGGLDLLGLPTWQAINVAALLGLAASGAAMWLWLRDKTPHALLWACLYMAAPYHLTDIYVRAALAESYAFAWLPLIALGMEGRPRLLAIAYAGLILTHLPTAVLASLFLIAPMLTRLTMRQLAGAAVAGTIGLGLAAIYLAPALTLQGHISTDQLGNIALPPDRATLWSGAIAPQHLAIVAALTALAGATLWTARRRGQPWLFAAIALAALAMAAGLVPVLWRAPVLRQVQFPFRALAIAEFAVVTALALAPPPRAWLRLGVGLAVIAWTASATYAAILVPAANAPQRLKAIERTLQDAPEYMPPGTAPKGLTGYDRLPRPERFLPADRFNFPIWRVDGRPWPGPVIPLGHSVTRVTLPVERAGTLVSLAAAAAWLLWLALSRKRKAPDVAVRGP